MSGGEITENEKITYNFTNQFHGVDNRITMVPRKFRITLHRNCFFGIFVQYLSYGIGVKKNSIVN